MDPQLRDRVLVALGVVDRHGIHNQKTHGRPGAKGLAKKAVKAATQTDEPELGPGKLIDSVWPDIVPDGRNDRASATASMRRTSDGRKLTTVVKQWQGASGQVEKIQRDFLRRGRGSTGSGRRDEHMDLLMSSIRDSKNTDRELFRGVKIPKNVDPESLVGTSVVIPPSSFSSDLRISRQFVDRRQQASTTVFYKMAAGKGRALPVELFGDETYAYEQEWVTAGQFKVTGAAKVRGGWELTIEQTAVFSWES